MLNVSFVNMNNKLFRLVTADTRNFIEFSLDKSNAGSCPLLLSSLSVCATKLPDLISQPLNIPVSTRNGHTSVILIPSLLAAFSSWLRDSWKPMAPNLLAQ